MILDYQNYLHQAGVTTAVTTAGRYVGNILDLTVGGSADLDKQLALVITMAAAAAGGTSLAFSLETHTAADFSAARTVIWSQAAIIDATLVAGYRVAALKVPLQNKSHRYLALVITGVGTHDAGGAAVDAFLTQEIQNNDL